MGMLPVWSRKWQNRFFIRRSEMTPTAIQLDSIIDRKSYQPKRDDLLKAINLTLREFDI